MVFVFDDVTYQQSFLDRIRAATPTNPPVLRRQPSYASALPLVEMGRGVMLYTLRMSMRDDLAMVPLDVGEKHTVGMMWRRGRRERALAAFADDVARHYREIGRTTGDDAEPVRPVGA